VKYSLAIFDSDGTLADTLPWMRVAYNEAANRYGLKRVSAEDEEHVRNLHGKELLNALHIPLWKLPRIIADLRKRMTDIIDRFETFPGIAESLQTLVDGGVQVAIVSSNSRENVERILGPETLKLVSYFDCGASLFGKASKIRRLVRKSGRPNAIYIGDEVRDAEAARQAGVAFGAVSWGHHRMAILAQQKPDECFESVEELCTRMLPPK
jgi:phosphoglycolate phosphatase